MSWIGLPDIPYFIGAPVFQTLHLPPPGTNPPWSRNLPYFIRTMHLWRPRNLGVITVCFVAWKASYSGSQHSDSKAARCASDSLATYGAIEMCFDWLIDWYIANSRACQQWAFGIKVRIFCCTRSLSDVKQHIASSEHKKNGQYVYLCWIHACVTFAEKVTVVVDIFANQQRGSFLWDTLYKRVNQPCSFLSSISNPRRWWCMFFSTLAVWQLQSKVIQICVHNH